MKLEGAPDDRAQLKSIFGTVPIRDTATNASDAARWSNSAVAVVQKASVTGKFKLWSAIERGQSEANRG